MIEHTEDSNTPNGKRSQSVFYLPTRLTYAAVVDNKHGEVEITEFMVRRACEEAEKQLQYPFAPRKRNAG